MKKYILLFIIVLLPFLSFSGKSKEQIQKEKEANEFFDMVKKDLDTISGKIDTTIMLSKEFGGIIKKEVKTYGLKKTIKANAEIFLPFAIFLILYLVWLKNRGKVEKIKK